MAGIEKQVKKAVKGAGGKKSGGGKKGKGGAKGVEKAAKKFLK